MLLGGRVTVPRSGNFSDCSRSSVKNDRRGESINIKNSSYGWLCIDHVHNSLTWRKNFPRTGCAGQKIWREPRFSGLFVLRSKSWRPCEGCLLGGSLRWPSHFSAEDCQNPPLTPGSFRHRFLYLFSFFFNFFSGQCFNGLSVKNFLTTSTQKFIRGVALACISGLFS